MTPLETYKYLHGLYNVNESDILPLSRNRNSSMNTRGHSLKLLKRNCHSQLRANFFGYRVVNTWNSLPGKVVTAESVNCFKGGLDRCYGERRFSRLDDVNGEIDYQC